MTNKKQGEISKTIYGATIRVKYNLDSREESKNGTKYVCFPSIEGPHNHDVSTMCEFYKGVKDVPANVLRLITKAMEK